MAITESCNAILKANKALLRKLRPKIHPMRRTMFVAYGIIGVCWLLTLIWIATMVDALIDPAGSQAIYSMRFARSVPRLYGWFMVAAGFYVFAWLSWLLVKIIRLELLGDSRNATSSEGRTSKRAQLPR